MATPQVVIVGGGFAGLTAAKDLARRGVRITLIDKRNHHLFQPLLYQVATAALSPAQIASPIRKVLSRYPSAEVLLGEVSRVEAGAKQVVLTDGSAIRYDYLILAAGATHSYFGHDEWEKTAPGLKTVEDALTIRRRFLLAFENAEREKDAAARQAELTFVIVGGGPTGVELAGAMIEIARSTIPRDFRAIDTKTAKVILVEATGRLLGGFPADLAQRALEDLTKLGVDVRLDCRVTNVDASGVTIESAGSAGLSRLVIPARNVVWAAGVEASHIGATLGVPLDKSGRVMVQPNLSVSGHPEVFVLGDLAHVLDPKTGGLVPGMAPGAIQMGHFAARAILASLRGQTPPPQFHYHDKGSLATIGRAKAIAAIGALHMGGLIAWMIWALVHITYLISFRNRISVMIEWAWYWLFFERGARLITNEGDFSQRR